jgi:fatty acid desaturase
MRIGNDAIVYAGGALHATPRRLDESIRCRRSAAIRRGGSGCPSQASLGDDLLTTTPYQRRLALARPFIALFTYALAARAGFWIATPFLVFLIFVSVVIVTHDVVHGSLGLSWRQTDWALFWLSAVLLESEHAYRATHLQHHAVFPGPNDPEGDRASSTERANITGSKEARAPA